MAVFFFLVGLEIKRELLEGNLSSRDQVILPALAAVGGMALPALVFSYFNWGDSTLMRGWAIPAATDIAFALGALSLAGSRVPLSLKVFLLTLATLDDLGAIIIIALFYTSQPFGALSCRSRPRTRGTDWPHLSRIDRTAPYIIVGVIMWVFVLKSGVHATLAGVVLALTIPLTTARWLADAACDGRRLHSYVKFLILPLSPSPMPASRSTGFAVSRLVEPLPLGIAAGLVLGKPIGIVLAVVIAVRLRLATLPEGCTWLHMIGVGCLAASASR